MPLPVWILTLSAFAIGTAEFVIAGLLTDVAESFSITEGTAGSLITAYAAAIVIGGPILTLALARFDKKRVLVVLMGIFIVGNLIGALTDSFAVLLVSRVIAGLTQGPFYGIGAVLATRLVRDDMAGRAVGQMFAGLTLANVLGVPAGAWIGATWGWNATFFVVAALGAIAAIAIAVTVPRQGEDAAVSIRGQLAAFRSWKLIASLLITVLAWTGFMTFYGYLAPVAEQVAGFPRESLTWVLAVVGLGLVIGNALGGRTADIDLRLSLLGWPAAMIVALAIVGVVAAQPIAFLVAAFLFGVTSFANVPPMQMRVLRYGAAAPELAATANISAFNVANALGGILGGAVVDSTLGSAAVPWAAVAASAVGLVFVASQELPRRAARVS